YPPRADGAAGTEDDGHGGAKPKADAYGVVNLRSLPRKREPRGHAHKSLQDCVPASARFRGDERRLWMLSTEYPRLHRISTSSPNIHVFLGLYGKFRAGCDIAHHVDDLLMADVVEAGHEQRIAALRHFDLCHTTLVGKRPIGMQQHMRAL